MPEAYNRLREFRHAVAVAALESDTDPGRNSTSLIVMTSYGYYSADVSGSRAVTFAASAVYTAHTQHCSTLAKPDHTNLWGTKLLYIRITSNKGTKVRFAAEEL